VIDVASVTVTAPVVPSVIAGGHDVGMKSEIKTTKKKNKLFSKKRML